MEYCFPDYQNCGLNVVSAVLNYFGIADAHPQHPAVQELLKKKHYKKVVLMLFDGMGTDILSKTLPEDAFLRTHMLTEMSAAYPSTTTCATSSIECCQTPREHGWLGWTEYFKEVDKLVDIFINRDQNGEPAAPYDVAETINPRHMVFDRFDAVGAKGHCISRFGTDPINDLTEMRSTLLRLCADDVPRYCYCYWGDPDHTMHEEGVYDESVFRTVKEVNDYVESLSRELPDDVLLMVTADHGLIDSRWVYVADHPELESMLLRMPSLEPRAAAFYVKPECVEAFPAAFKKAFGEEHFLLMTSKKFVEKGYLGAGKDNFKLWDFVGDYMALAIDPTCIGAKRGDHELKGVHAGLTRQEMKVPLIVAKK